MGEYTFGFLSGITHHAWAGANDLVGCIYTCVHGGEAQSITVQIEGTLNDWAKCALYKNSDLSFVGGTEEKQLSGIAQELTFNFAAPPTLLANTEYLICVWVGGDYDTFRLVGTTNQSSRDVENYNGFPGTFSKDASYDEKQGFLCTYDYVGIPFVTTQTASDILFKSATLNGNITDRGGVGGVENNDERGFEWGIETGVYPNSWTEEGSFGLGIFSHGITGLVSGKTYFFRSKSHNSEGWGYGSEQSFVAEASMISMVEGTNWGFLIYGGEKTKVVKVDLTEVEVHDGYFPINGTDPKGIVLQGDYLYISCQKDENNTDQPKILKIKKDFTSEAELLLAAIDTFDAETVSDLIVDPGDSTVLWVIGSVIDGSTIYAAIWKIALGTFTISDSAKYTTFQANRVYEDFQGFTIADPDSRFTLYHHNCLDFDAQKDETSYIYKDFTAAHFDDFTHKVKASIASTPDDGGRGYIWMVATALGNAKALDDACEDYIGIYFVRSGATYSWFLEECNGGAIQSDCYNSVSLDTDYFFAVTKSATSLTCEIYSTQTLLDAGGSGDVDSLTLTITDNTFRYLYGGNTYNDTTDVSCDLDVENLDIGELTYNGEFVTFYVDTSSIYALTANGMFFKLTKSDLSENDSAYSIPCGSSYSPKLVAFFCGTSWADFYFVIGCSLKHIVKIRTGVWGIERSLAEPDGDWTLLSCVRGQTVTSVPYLYVGSGNINEIKKVECDLDMSVSSTLALSTGTEGIKSIMIIA